MNQMDAGDELSMEDILASIRQIIADEPKGVAPPQPLVQPSVVQAQSVQNQPVQAVTSPVSQAPVQVTTIGIPQGYAPTRPDAVAARVAAPSGIPLPSFADSRMRPAAPFPLSPRTIDAASQPLVPPARPQTMAAAALPAGAAESAPAGTLAARLNDVFGAGAALRQPDNGRPASHYAPQTVRSALDADLADLMDDDQPAAAVPVQPITPAPAVVPAPQVAAAVEPLVTQPVVVAAMAKPASAAETEPTIAVVATPPMTSIMQQPHPLPTWLNRAPDPETAEVASQQSAIAAPAIAADVTVIPVGIVTPPVEAAAPPKPRPAPVVIAAMVAAPKPVSVAPVLAPVSAPDLAPVVASAAVAPAAVTPVVTSAVLAPALSMADVLPASDVAPAWVPAAHSAREPDRVPADVAPSAVPAIVLELPVAALETQADAAVASALGALAAGLAASRLSVAPEFVVAAAPLPVAIVTEAAPVSDAVPADVVDQSAIGLQAIATQDARSDVVLEPAYPHDETAVELLRPMLRHWLDSNMPRIVEKALRAELAANPPGAAKTDSKA